MKREYENRDLHAEGDGGGGGCVEEIAAETAVEEDVYGREGGEFDPMEIWLESVDEDQQHLDVNDFPPLPDFPCMSSSSSTSSAPAGVAKLSSSSTASSSSSSAASWAEDAKKIQLLQLDASAQPGSAMTPGASGDARSAAAAPEESFTDEDCINVMENLGYMDFINGDDIWDPCSIFQTENFQDEPSASASASAAAAAAERSQLEELQKQQSEINAAENTELSFLQGNSELAVIFFEWLKQNKDYISAEDMRSIKLKRSTIESASKRLGSSKEGKKQLLKLILEWVQQYQLQKKKSRESAANSDHQAAETFLNSITTLNSIPNPNFQAAYPAPAACFYTPPYIHPDSNTAAAMMAAAQPPFSIFQPPPMGYNNIAPADPYNCGAAPFAHMNTAHFPPHPAEYHHQPVDSAQSWPSSEFVAAASQPFNPFPDNECNRIPAESAQPQALYGSEYPYQLFDGNGERLVRLGSSATKEARKKRMARQRRLSGHHFRHQNHHNNLHHSQNCDQLRIGVENCAIPHQVNNLGNWVYWPPGASDAPPPPQMVVVPPPEAVPPQQHPVERPPLVQKQNQPKQGSSERQGVKIEKHMKFLLQKVLKQSDVNNLGRIVLPKKEAETQLPELESRDGISLAIEDIGTTRVWNMKYRFWPNNKSRMYLLENTGDFVRANGLQEGDFIVLYADTKCGKYKIRGVKVRQHGPRSEGKKPPRKNPRMMPSLPASTSPSPLSLIKQTVN